jgi:polyisoprenoid-binding protein YceI
VVIPFKFLGKAKDPWGSTRIGFEGNLTLNRQDYGIAFNKTIDNGGLLVGNEVEIQLNIEAVLQNK